MTAVTGRNFPVGARRATLFALNASGSPAASSTTAYTGVQVVGARALEMTVPDPRKFTHVGDDNVLAVQYLPPTEGMSGVLNTAAEDLAIVALVTGTNVVTIGETKLVGVATSQQGSESQFGMLMVQQTQASDGTANYRYWLFPKVKAYPKHQGMGQDILDHSYTISPSIVTKHLWETTFNSTTEGFTYSQGLVGQATYIPTVASFLAATATTNFVLSTAQTGADTAKMVVYVDGVADTAWTKGTQSVTTGTAPGNLKRVVVFYEATA